ncbi:MAG: hypothetical protein JNL42_20055, partial [Anaerolineae bacterium]|nr:hypothetical protein [Anaerolineae bacterium]
MTPPEQPAPARSSADVALRALLIFFGLLVIAVVYFWSHRPFGIEPGSIPPAVLTLGGAALDMLTAAALFLAAGAVGGWGVERLRLRSTAALSRLEWLALETGVGLGALALPALLLGLVGLFQPLLLWGILAALLLLLRRRAVEWARGWRALLGALRVRSGWEAFALVWLGAMLVLALIYGLAPPTHWDSLTYHLVAPTRYLRAGRIAAHPDVFYLGFSQNVEMLYSYAVGAFGRTSAAAPVHFGIGLLALMGLIGVARRHAGRWAGWTAGLILLSSYNLWALFGWAYVDLAALLYGALALIAVTAWSESLAVRWIVIMGGIAGLAAGVKYNAGALGLAMGAAVLLTQPRRALQHGVIMAGVALIVFAPWALKGLALYGNPVYPFALGGLEWDAGRTAAFTFPDFSFSGRGWLWHVPILPFAATVFGQDNVDGYGFTLGMWLLTSFAALPLLWRWLLPRERALARAALIFIGALWAFWAAAGWSSGVGIQTR